MGEACGTLIRLKSNDFHPKSKQDQSETFPQYAREGMVLISFSQKPSSLGWVFVGPEQVLLMPLHASLPSFFPCSRFPAADKTLMKSPSDKRSHSQNALQPVLVTARSLEGQDTARGRALLEVPDCMSLHKNWMPCCGRQPVWKRGRPSRPPGPISAQHHLGWKVS